MTKLKMFLQTYWLYLIPIILAVGIVVYHYALWNKPISYFDFDYLTVFGGVLSIILFAMCSFEWLPWLHRNIHRPVALFFLQSFF